MTDVIIHIFPGMIIDQDGEFDKMKSKGITHFKNYLLSILGHVGISFPDNPTVYGYGPNVTQENLDNLRDDYQKKVIRGGRYIPKIKWTALNFLFNRKSPVFNGIISDNTQFFERHKHIKIQLKLINNNANQAMTILNGIKAKYGSQFSDSTKENCLTAIFDHLSFTYTDGKPVILKNPSMLRYTLQELQENSNSVEISGKKGGKKSRRKSRRKSQRKSRRKSRRKKN